MMLAGENYSTLRKSSPSPTSPKKNLKRPGQELSPYLRGEMRGRIKCQMMRKDQDSRGEGGSLFKVVVKVA